MLRIDLFSEDLVCWMRCLKEKLRRHKLSRCAIKHTEFVDVGNADKGACEDVVLGNLTQTLANIKPAVAAVSGHEGDRSSGNAAFVQAVANKNVVLTLERIRERSPILTGMVDKGDIGLAGAMYDVHTGQVVFM